MRLLAYIGFAAAMWMSATVSPAGADSIEVLEYACARQVVDRQPAEIIDCKAFQLPSPVYLWVRLRGDASALQELKAGKPIIIRHKWVRFAGPNPDVQTMRADEELSGGRIDPRYFERLQQEVNSRGYFDWRTWTYKAKVRPTAYTVEVMDKAFKPIHCSSGGTASPCEIQVRIEE